MSRLSREKKREQQPAAQPAALVAAPIDVRVLADGPGAGGATVGGVPVPAVPGEEIQQTVLNHLHRIAVATGHPVRAMIHDERIGYVVPLEVAADGASSFAGDPVRMAPPGERTEIPGEPARGEASPPPATPAPSPAPPAPASSPALHAPPPAPPALPAASAPAEIPRPEARQPQLSPQSEPEDAPQSGPADARQSELVPTPQPEDAPQSGPVPTPHSEPEDAPQSGAVPAPQPEPEDAPQSRPVPSPQSEPEDAPPGDKPTRVMRSVVEPVRDSASTFPLRAVSEPQPLGENVPTFPLRALPEPVQDRAPGTVAPPQGVFGPPPVMDAVPQRPALEAGPAVDRRTHEPAPHPLPPAPDALRPAAALESTAGPIPASTLRPQATTLRPETTTHHSTSSTPSSSSPSSSSPSLLAFPTEPEPDPKHTPARGFDAVAEAVLGDDPPTGPGFLAEPMGRINEAVKAGRIDEAAGVAERTVAEAMAVLGTEHPEVLRLRELSAYIAYLAGEPVRAFRLSLDLARIHRRTGDPEAAYGNIQSAASAWRAVRDPRQGLELGRDLIDLWTELTNEGGPAAEDVERLDTARARMDRLTERARKSAQ
ncbi:tetratricopeptide repeat protein [Streptomyces sp. CA-249302]|uniref:tetratricopeptide repeat protein n=1 Tax=Streptomyces sp. CA-249302 TaxID=3240058 RepID=UPI003D9147FD